MVTIREFNQKRKRTKEEIEEDKRVGHDFIKEREKALAAGLTKTEAAKAGAAAIGSSSSAAVQQRTEELRKEQFQEVTGSGELKAELQSKIAAPPSLAPEPIGKVIKKNVRGALGVPPDEEQGLPPGEFFKRAINGSLTQTELKSTLKTAGKAAAIVGGALAVPYLAKAAVGSVVGKAVLGKGGSLPFLKTAIAGLAIYTVGGSIFDWRGDEMDTLRRGINGVTQDGERIEAIARQGGDTGDNIALLQDMAEEIGFAETRIKEIGNNNLQYRVSKEYIEDMKDIRSARLALLRRVQAIENMAATGSASVDPEALLFEASRI